MTKQQMQIVIEALLNKHFSLDLNDTPFCDIDGFNSNFQPFELVNWWADECDLDRTDYEGFYGTPSKKPLTLDDQNAVITE